MLSETMITKEDRKKLYDTLGDLAVSIETALKENDDQKVMALVSEHDGVMETIKGLGDETDPEMTVPVSEAGQKIRQLISTIQTMQKDIRNQLTVMNNRNLIRTAYQSKDAR